MITETILINEPASAVQENLFALFRAMATVPAARRKGIDGEIRPAPQLVACQMGYRHVVLFSMEIAIRAHERIGFCLLNTHINRYL